MKSIMNCTADSPMPANRDQMGQVWFHHGAQLVSEDGNRRHMRCPNCSHEFTLTLGKKVTIAEAKAKSREMRARGLRPTP